MEPQREPGPSEPEWGVCFHRWSVNSWKRLGEHNLFPGLGPSICRDVIGDDIKGEVAQGGSMAPSWYATIINTPKQQQLQGAPAQSHRGLSQCMRWCRACLSLVPAHPTLQYSLDRENMKAWPGWWPLRWPWLPPGAGHTKTSKTMVVPTSGKSIKAGPVHCPSPFCAGRISRASSSRNTPGKVRDHRFPGGGENGQNAPSPESWPSCPWPGAPAWWRTSTPCLSFPSMSSMAPKVTVEGSRLGLPGPQPSPAAHLSSSSE